MTRLQRIRRLAWSRLERIWRWEFWPLWLVYLPVVGSAVFHGIRLRGLTLWASCNPAMDASGMAMEKKGEILDSFRGQDGRVKLARYLRIHPGEAGRVGKLKTFLSDEELSWPIVLKPDLGQRGQGVAVVQSIEEAVRWLEKCQEGAVAQEFVGGLEFGVHWSKFPDEETGMIESLCGKHPQNLVGDGKRTLEELILSDDRAVLMSRYYFKKYSEKLKEILGAGEVFEVAPIGSHSMGAVFTDERHLITDKLREAFDELGARFPGFNFGRYDVKVPSIEDLKEGRNITVLELNGVMGEPAHVYQPGYPWRKGMRDLVRHYALAAEIGAAWRSKGVKPSEPGDLLELVRQHMQNDYLDLDDK